MRRYHRDLGFPEEYDQRLRELNDKFNRTRKYGRTRHSVERIKQRFNFLEIVEFLSNEIVFHYDDIFECCIYNGAVQKVCYRVEFKELALIIVLSKDKNLVTVYANNLNDNHKTLNKSLYATV